ncbi:MAG TPA: AbiV family abortive infection protein [Longimicrobium sp.]|nr:AbiV family abortive infection protein [Longimicrobium sp.]
MTKKQKLSAQNRELALLLDREIVSRFAAIALINSRCLYQDALALYERGSYGTSRSLAIGAREECGKVNIAAHFLAEAITVEEFVSQIRDHKPKQAEGAVPPWFAEKLQSNEFQHLLTINIEDDLATTIGRLTSSMTDQHSEWERALIAALPSLREEHEAATAGVHESDRQAGLYVTFKTKDGSVQIISPFEVTKEQCDVELNRLRSVMDDGLPFTIPEQLEENAPGTTFEEIASELERTFTPGLFSRAESEGNTGQT